MGTYAEIFPPGEFLKDELEARNWSQVEFAEIIGRPVRLVNEIISGKRSITAGTALQLEASLGTSAELWMNLESQYQLSKARQGESSIQRKARVHGRFPVREIAKRGWVTASEDIEVLEHELTKFYCLQSLDDSPTLAHAAKKASYGSASMAQWSWLFRVKHVAQSFAVPKYDRSALIASLSKIKALMSAPEESRHLPKLLNAVGVRFVIVETLPGSKIDGACMWLDDKQPVVALSARLDRIDNFWFVLRHEVEHLIQEHGKDARMVLDEDIFESLASNEKAEEEMANDAASQFAVSDSELNNYMARVNPYFFSRDRILGFAHRLGVHPGIVVGRLQKKLEQKGQPDSYKYLRDYLVKVRHLVTPVAPTDGWGTVYPTQ